MKTWCEQLLAEQYAEDRSKAYYVDESGEWKWYITERGRYSKVDFLAGYKAAKDNQEYLMNEMSILRSRLDTAEKLSQLVDENKEQ